MEAIGRATPFVDAGHTGNTWKPSELLIIGYCMIATGTGDDERAVAYLNEFLGEARNRYAAGFYANPFEEPVRVRP